MSSIYGSAKGANVIFGENNTGVASGGAAAGPTLTDGLKAYYTFGDSSTTQENTASDVGSTDAIASSDVTLYGNTTYDETGHVSGVNAIGFPTYNVTGNYATSSNAASDYDFMVTDSVDTVWTVVFWCASYHITHPTDWWGTNGGGSGDDIMFRNMGSEGGSSKFTIWFAGNEITTFTQTLTDSNWHMYTVQWNEPEGLASFQIDDGTIQTKTSITTSNTSSPPAPIRWGDVSANEAELDTQLFFLYNRILTTDEILELWNDGAGKAL